MKKIEFPKDFLWGGAVSAEQTEGMGASPKGETVYERHYKDRPKDFFGGIGPEKVIDFTNTYKEDIKLMKKFGINSHRTSISWARVFPDGNYDKPNAESVKLYHDIIDEFNKNGIELMLTVYHFDMPMYAMDKGGFESREVWEDFVKYCAFIFDEFGSKVKMWTTMNEPLVPIQCSYIAGIQYPFLKDDQKAVNAAYGVVMSHAMVVNHFNEVVKKKYPQNMIGGIFNSAIVYPADENNPEDVKAAKYLDLYQFTGLTDAMVGGYWKDELVEWIKDMDLFPQNWDEKDRETLSKIKLDLVGLNFYAPQRAIAPKGKAKNKFEEYFTPYNMPGRRENKFRGWEIYPEALHDTMKVMYERYGKDKKYMLTEYGMGVENEAIFRDEKTGEINDNYRVAFMKEHLHQLNKLMTTTDINVIGAHCWATFDCWSWNNAFKNRYGLFEVDIKTMKRTPKASAHFMQSLVKEHGFNDDYKLMEEYMDFDSLEFSESVKA